MCGGGEQLSGSSAHFLSIKEQGGSPENNCAGKADNCAGFPDNCLPGWYRVPPGGRAWGRVPSGGVGLSSMRAGVQEEEPGSPELLPGSPEELLVPPEPLPLAGRIFSRIWRSCLARLVFLPRPPVMKSMRLEKPS